ncbi:MULTISPECIES: c-type cytochrome [Methylotenera]|uniref:c-type cytochrome n=1 Tax=Methylotenera TaxID=359407 RepID=UPI001E307AE8|nr:MULTISPECIES: cytochrome c [Methylotenera]
MTKLQIKSIQLKSIATVIVTTVLMVTSTASLAEQTPKPEKLIQWRQSAYRIIEWNVSRIKSSIQGTYNKAEVVAAANAIAGIANSGLPVLFVPGTEKGKGWHETAANAEVFKDKAKFTELSNNFSKEATELAKIAASANDASAIKEQFGKVTRSCKACHDDFKGDD